MDFTTIKSGDSGAIAVTMKAFVCRGPGRKAFRYVDSRKSRRRGRYCQNSKDNDLRTDLHILKGDVPNPPARPHSRP